jgi:hypothetical protein
MEQTFTAPAAEHQGIVARWHLPTVFAAVFLAFCLPFATVSCNGAETTFTGMQLVTHTVPHGGTFEDEDGRKSELSDRVERKSSIPAAIVLLLAAAGLGFGLLGTRRTGWCASLGLLFTVILGMNTGGGFLSGPDVTYHGGYWSTLLLFVWACLVHIGRGIRNLLGRA